MKKVIIDCDPGIDDSLALLLALKSSELDVIGITICAGNVPVEIGGINAYRVLKMLNREDIPIYLGDNNPMRRDLVTAQDTHGDDGVGDILPKVEIPKDAIKLGAVDYLLDTLKEKENVSIIALGPMTNLAKAVERERDILKKAERIVSMGGAFRTNGNCSQVGEFNYWVDPESVNIVFENVDRPIELIPLDVTRKIVLTPNYREYLKQMKNDVAQFMYDITGFYVDFHWMQERTLGCVINDPLAVAYFIEPSLCSGILTHLECVETGRAMGQTLIDIGDFYRKTPNVFINTEVDEKKFFELFFNKIFPENKKDNELVLKGY
ncbi:nucleoside hydrolase [Candidatus Cetobacterium colombiensis]|uniref:Nucleoside hydrolase n=1 Tax=Candidatus Cetobacterium colombiensis TaxID=3073100 RepID=A0ABU4W7R2_9FUSO|nr:nucleoside hydrolase [Candidatus Cetobacterium colombiensis]MDX8335225.1 nucleoside hydrolase [Candidatus Cetobacterium colombiensis]